MGVRSGKSIHYYVYWYNSTPEQRQCVIPSKKMRGVLRCVGYLRRRKGLESDCIATSRENQASPSNRRTSGAKKRPNRFGDFLTDMRDMDIISTQKCIEIVRGCLKNNISLVFF
ncbi:unnamed protein product [Lepeophtheirus salmonis]|uniref:(salmon louse) hypothetical protein n=1 Tax=Lepeophtheirus salmonis TaxID=72036 RepID=A0A7R8CZW9_LEPSM|nr:unnamed protein product [Lepeophtheirus salmonis]CAF2979180.1 unnamed protein product [Lepeophtheirus salmonis]